ncbi:MAG: tetratricopeptide repeat protein, partial [Faecousia sp.]
MKQIKIFLASSICAFAQERQELKGYISALNDIYVERGVYFKLILCENLSKALSSERKQEEYNQEIRDSQFFYVILGSEAGDYTREEFEVARKSFLEKQTPKIYTYFKQLPEGEAKQSVLDFMGQLDKELGHYYSVFAHIDSIKLDILLELTRCVDVRGAVTLEEGTVKLDGKPMLSMEHIPLYSKNEAVQRLLEEKKQLEDEFAALTQMASLMRDNPAYTRMLLENSKKRNALAEQLHTLEMDVLGLCRTAAEKRSLGQHLNWREQKALTFIDEGDYEAAKNLLRDETWKQEVAHAEETIDLALEPIREYISGQTTLIQTIKTGGVTAESAAEIEAIYDELTALCEKHRIALTTLYGFASFLKNQKKYAKALRIAEQLKHYYDAPKSQASAAEKSRLLNLLGILSAQHRFAEGEAAFREALEICRSLAEENPDAYQLDVAATCNNLANLLNNQHHPEAAERLYREALEVYRSLAKENPDAYLPNMATACNNLAILLTNQHRAEEAERLYREALEIRRSLAEENPDAFLPDVAATCNSLANLLKDQHRTEEAERLFREALEIRRSLAEKNPDAFLPDVAATCNNLANLLK